jgi:hypothetical protein
MNAENIKFTNDNHPGKPKRGSVIRGALKTSRRVGYAVTILPILLPILCLCILCILFLTIISSLSGGGPDQTQNISNATTECTGELDVCDRIQDSVRSRTGE